LKPENIFLEIDEDQRKILKVGDFGVAKQFDKESMDVNIKSTLVGTPGKKNKLTTAYMAPEIMTKNYNQKVDLFSVGSILYKLMTNKERSMWTDLTNNLDETVEEIKESVMKFEYPVELLNLTLNLLSLKPEVRLDAKQTYNALVKLSKSVNFQQFYRIGNF
jgi:serine/threonine protein kinase